jgi:leader peptidase (prepilin peptidase)/N-methyltransferase
MSTGVISLCAAGSLLVTIALIPFAESVERARRPAAAEVATADGTPEPLSPQPVSPEPVSPGAMTLSSWILWILIGAGAMALLAAHFGAVPELGAYCALAEGLLLISLVDLRVFRIPARFVYVTGLFVALGLVAASLDEHRYRALGDAAIGGAIGFVAFYLLWFLYPKGIGFGDVRLAGLIGMSLGWLGLLYLYVGFTAGFLAGTVFGLALLVRWRAGRKTPFPFGPSLALGTMVALVWGHSILHGVLHSR